MTVMAMTGTMIEIMKTMAIMAMVGGGGRGEGSSFAGNPGLVEQLGRLQAAGDDDNDGDDDDDEDDDDDDDDDG